MKPILPEGADGPRVLISVSALNAMHQHLAAAYPNEGCGILIGEKTSNGAVEIQRAAGTRNCESPHGRDRYAIDSRDFLSIERELDQRPSGPKVVGFFHSHPDAKAIPSHTDLEMAQGVFDALHEVYVYAIMSVNHGVGGELTCWQLSASTTGFAGIDWNGA